MSRASFDLPASSPKCSSPSMLPRRGRPCGRWAMAAAATSFAVSVSSASAFQTAAPMHLSARPTLPYPPTTIWTVTDPDTLLKETSHRRLRTSVESLENMYFVSPDMEPLSVSEVEWTESSAPQRTPRRSSLPTRNKTTQRKASAKADVDTSPLDENKEQVGVDSGSENQKKHFKAVSLTPKKIRKRTTMKSARVSDKDGKKTAVASRSSTMPGFSTRHMTGRVKAFNDGIKIAEQRSGKKLTKLVNNKEAQNRRKKQNSEAMYHASASVPDSLVQFANEIHMEERITPTDEIDLGTKTQEAIRLQSLYDNLEDKLDREPTDEEWCAAAGKLNMEALQQVIEEGLEAKNRLVTANLRMVQGVVNMYIRNGLGGQYNAGDMMQEGIMGLIRAAEKYEPKRGFRFSTYAMYWIRAAVKRSQILQSRVINVPQRLFENHKRVMRVENELKQTLGRDPSRKELADAVGMSELQLERCVTAMSQRIFSLDAEITNTQKPNSGDGNGENMYELIGSKTDDGEHEKLERIFMREDLVETLYRHLTPHEVDLLLLRFGLMDERTLPHGFGGPLTIAEVSRLVGLKPDRVRRMINNSLKQLKYLIANEWDDFEREIE